MCSMPRLSRIVHHHYAIFLAFGIITHPGVSKATHEGPNCSLEVQAQFDALCPGNSVTLVQPSGAESLLCMPPPEEWGGDMIFNARGNALFPPDDCKAAVLPGQLEIDGTSLRGLANQLWFGFITTTCEDDFLALKECIDDMTDLRQGFQDYLDTLESHEGLPGTAYGQFDGQSFVTGVSLGGLTATKLIEPDNESLFASTFAGVDAFATDTSVLFDGALAACGPIGSFKDIVNYQGDLLVLVDYFFRRELRALTGREGLVFPDEERKPVVSPSVLAALDEISSEVATIIDADLEKAGNILRIMEALGRPVPFVPNGVTTIGEVFTQVIFRDTIPAITFSEIRFAGNPFDNLSRVYFDPDASDGENRRTNRFIDRLAADGLIDFYETLGLPQVPHVSLHGIDWRVPRRQAFGYWLKVLENGEFQTFIPSSSIGHCTFSQEEILAALGVLFFQVWGFDLLGAEAMLEEPEALGTYYGLVDEYRGEWRP